MNINDLSTQLLYTTVPVWGIMKDHSQVSGTGFIFSLQDENDSSKTIPLLITNFHVLKDIEHGMFELCTQKDGIPQKEKGIRISFDASTIQNNKLGELDLVAIPIAATLNAITDNVFYKSISQDIIPDAKQRDSFSALEEITFIGYPSGLYDSYNKTSIIRRGITATPLWNNYQNTPTFLIDANVFPGSSGSPIFVLNQGSYATTNGITIGSRLFFVGIVTETLVRSDTTYLNLGSAIHSYAMIPEIKKFVHRLLNH